MAGRPGTAGDPVVTAWWDTGTWGSRAGTPTGTPSSGGCALLSSPCKPHPQRVGQDRGYFTCASWFYSNFPISPCTERAQPKATETPGCGLTLALPAGDGSRAVASLISSTPPCASEGVVLAAHPRWEITSCFFLYIFPTKCCWRSGEPTE